MIKSFLYVIAHTVTPFQSQPPEISPLPEAQQEPSADQIRHCQWLFDQAEARHSRLEQKAQSVFGLMIFVVPLLSSVLVFVVVKLSGSQSHNRLVALGFVFLSALFVLLGFLSVLRAVFVKGHQTLYLDSIIDPKTGMFLAHRPSDHAQGLIYCASMNTAMNDHIAQFVKGGQVLLAAAVFSLLLAALPALSLLIAQRPAPSETKITGTVIVASDDLKAIQVDLASISSALSRQGGNGTSHSRPGGQDTTKASSTVVATSEDVEALRAEINDLKSLVYRQGCAEPPRISNSQRGTPSQASPN